VTVEKRKTIEKKNTCREWEVSLVIRASGKNVRGKSIPQEQPQKGPEGEKKGGRKQPNLRRGGEMPPSRQNALEERGAFWVSGAQLTTRCQKKDLRPRKNEKKPKRKNAGGWRVVIDKRKKKAALSKKAQPGETRRGGKRTLGPEGDVGGCGGIEEGKKTNEKGGGEKTAQGRNKMPSRDGKRAPCLGMGAQRLQAEKKKG